MNRWGYILLGVCAALTVVGDARSLLAQESGTVVVDVKNYTSAVKIPKNTQKRFQHAGIQWGMLDNAVIFTFVGQNFVKARISNFTRFGEQQTLDLKPGQYTITCIGYEWGSTSKDPDKNLSKSGFFNNDVVTFTVLPGKKTTLEVSPIYVTEAQWFLWAKMNLYIPDLKVRMVVDGTPTGDAVVISKRTDKSVAWDNYHGPLKF